MPRRNKSRSQRLLLEPGVCTPSVNQRRWRPSATNERAKSASDGGAVVVRQNWFPRWEATINGEPVPVERRADGYMELQAPAGRIELRLTYGLTAVDWLARLAAAAGIAVLVIAIWIGWSRPGHDPVTHSDSRVTDPLTSPSG